MIFSHSDCTMLHRSKSNNRFTTQPQLHISLLLYYSIIVTLSYLTQPCQSLDFIRRYHTFPNNAARPKFIVQPTDQTVELGSRVQLKCSGEASPPPMMYWYKEGHRQLMFPPAPSSSSSSRSPQQQTSWPQVASLTTNSDISPATNRLFSMPISSMDHLASQSNYFANRIYVDNQGTLNIINVTSSDNGYWACALISSVGSVMAKAKLTVKQPPNQPNSASTPDYLSDPLQQARLNGLTMFSGTSGKYDLLPPPVIKMGSANQTLPTNTSTNLLCDVVSQVAYKIQWFFDSQPLIEEPPRISTLENGNLGINELRTSDSGIYTCVVTAANDQNMPLASPYEPLDASMLTSAPPIQQSTSHSCMLKVASPTNPNIQFFRMDLYTYPSSPGIPYFVTTNGMDAVTIAWAPPADSGILPIKQYVVEHYDSSQEHLGWKEIHRVNGKESLLIDGLSPDGSHFFVVRATNSHGVGPSSAIAGPIRTQSGEIRYQLEQQRRRNPSGLEFADTRLDANQARDRLMTVTTNLISLTPVGSNSIRLQWSTQSVGNSSFSPLNSMAMGDFLEGYSIRYRAVGIGESLIGKDPLLGLNLNQLETKSPSSLPLVTSYLDEEDISISPRLKRDLTNYYDYSQEFNEVRITDHVVEHYTINGLKPFTTYQFFVVPYFKDVDGIPSNILTAQTNEDRPSVAPPMPSIRPINNTAVRLIWPHISTLYANGIIRGYYIRINSSDILNGQTTNGQQVVMSIAPKVLTLPLESLLVAPLVNQAASDTRNPLSAVTMQQYIVVYDISNLTHKSFYSIQVAGFTNPELGPGPWSESKNFVMDPRKIAEQIKSNGIELDGMMSQTFLSTVPNSLDDQFGRSHEMSSLYIIMPVILMIVGVILASGYILYRRNNQQVITWKKTISEHFANKFYLPSAVDHHHRGPDTIQQNIYDHQHHLIYSAGSTHMPQHTAPNQAIWAQGSNNGTGCINSSGTGSLSSHGGLVPISNDPNSIRDKVNNDQILLLNNNKDANSRFARPDAPNGGVFCSADPSRTLNQNGANQQIIHHGGDYYSVINTVSEYEELDLQQRNNMHIASTNVLERHLTGSSNSDTSCPSSVTRLLPNQNYNRDLLNRSSIENQQRHEMILQQQMGCNGDIKQPFLTVINANDSSKFQQPKTPLAPYATTNLIHQMAHQQPQQTHIFTNPQVNLMNQTRQQQNFIMQNGGSTLDDSSKILMSHQMNGGNGHNAMNSFRTLQRNHNNIQPTIVHSQPTHIQQIFMQNDHGMGQFVNNHNNCGVGQQLNHNNLMNSNPLIDPKANLYEPIEYNGGRMPVQISSSMQVDNSRQHQGDLISSSTSSGSMKSPPDTQMASSNASVKYRRGSLNPNGAKENEAHDLRVFTNVHASRPSDASERQRLNGTDADSQSGQGEEDRDEDLIDETTAFRRQSAPGDEQRTRQLSKRKRKQHRNRLHNNNQQIG